MKGKPEVLTALHDLLPDLATCMAQVRANAQILRSWGYEKLKHKLHGFFYNENDYTKQIINRYLFLDGVLDSGAFAAEPKIGSDVPEMFHNDLDAVNAYIISFNDAIEIAEEGDNTTAKILRKILKGLEKQAQWYEIQLRQIGDLGLDGYLSEQLEE